MARLSPLAGAGYFLAAFLVVVPFLDLLLTIWPLSPGLARWRFGAVGFLARAVMSPILGVFLATAISALVDHRRTTRTLAWLTAVGGLVLTALSGVFALDAVQTRAATTIEARRAFEAAAATGLVKLLLAALALGFIARGAFRVLAADRSPSRPKEAAPRRVAGA
jgi:hypothetical protein